MATPKKKKASSRPSGSGHGQLTLVEHSLCPLDPETSLTENLVHSAKYHFTDGSRHLQTAHARVFCPMGLSANDEFFLWGLLSITLSQPQSESEFYATPHYCLRQLGLIDQHARRGGRQYQQFSDSLARLAAVVYQNDQFYDPLRAEHRKVSFGFLSYSLPLDEGSCRSWRISWNPIFFDMVQAAAGGFRFDLATYRSLEPASRRLFLLLSKIFQRRATSPRFDLHNLAIDVLGFSSTITASDLKKKIRRCVERLRALGIVSGSESAEIFEKQQAGRYRVTLQRGPYFERKAELARLDVGDSALSESLASLGLEPATVRRLVRQHSLRVLQEWADITLAARERFGLSFFKRSPAAYFVNNVQHVARDGRSAPDWWLELRKAELHAQAAESRRRREQAAQAAHDDALSADAREAFTKIVGELFQQFQAAGQPPEAARVNAERFARTHLQRASRAKKSAPGLTAALRVLVPNDPSF
ncbi:MAG TPA: hypothetical protein VMM76_21375 [Pirellulaceae bacterium]|nr:hypothetical protein [Pirellulaceae bacterium]